GECEGAGSSRVGGGVERGRDGGRGSSRQSLVEMQLDLLLAAAGDERLDETRPLSGLEQRGAQPHAVVAVKKSAALLLVALPVAMMRSGARPLVRDHRSVAGDLPPVPRGL